MDNSHVKYYYEMANRNRLVPVYVSNKLVGVITFLIGDNNIDKYVRDNPWELVDDEPDTGHICYVDQLISNGYPKNTRYSFMVMGNFIDYIEQKFPHVKVVRWNRFKNGKVNVFTKKLPNRGCTNVSD